MLETRKREVTYKANSYHRFERGVFIISVYHQLILGINKTAVKTGK